MTAKEKNTVGHPNKQQEKSDDRPSNKQNDDGQERFHESLGTIARLGNATVQDQFKSNVTNILL